MFNQQYKIKIGTKNKQPVITKMVIEKMKELKWEITF